MLRKIRRTAAAVVFLLITLLFLDVSGTLHTYLGWLAMIQFWPALLAMHIGIVAALIVLTLIGGRIYCSVICPMGIMQDLISNVHTRFKKNSYKYSPEQKVLRYSVLTLFIIAFLAGFGSLVALLSPYSSYGRIAVNIIKPVWELGNNFLAALAEHFNSYAFYSTDIWIKSTPTLIIAVVTLLFVAHLAWWHGRTYCNAICPVGTVLSFLARFSLFKISINESKCVNCGLCARNCKAGCIDFKNHEIDYSRCVVCGNCIGKCKKDAIQYILAVKRDAYSQPVSTTKSTRKTCGTDTSRRAFLFGITMATTAAMAQRQKKVDGGLAEIADKEQPQRTTPLTPPGSHSAQNMAKHCTACQLCVSACPNGVLRPSTDLLKFMQPTLSYERGYCRPECTRCSEVCPTGAIKDITKAEKSSIQIGHAVWVKKNCVPLTDGVECGNCARHCPVGAITMIQTKGQSETVPRIPAINTARCIGCGACENLCPARPFSAVYVEGHEMHRTV